MAKIGDLAGSWKCPYCGTKDIWGYEFECPGCGICRPKGIRFYLRPGAPKLTAEQVALMGSNPNWYCEHCDSGNPSTEENCWQCGAQRGDSPTHRKIDYRDRPVPSTAEEAEMMATQDPFEKVSIPHPPTTPNPRQKSTPPPLFTSTQPEKPKEHKPSLSTYNEEPPWVGLDASKIIPAALISLAIILVTYFSYQFFFNTHQELVQVSGFNWTQNVIVQEYQVVNESSWTTHPNDAYNIISDYRDTGRDEKVHDGWKTVKYQDTCYKTVSYQDTCTRPVYHPKTCTGTTNNGDGSYSTYTYECGSSSTETYSCTKTKQKSYSCTKTRQEELYHYEDIYDWYYEYDINRWVTIAEYPTSGNDHEPYYSTDFTLNNPYSGSGTPELGQQQQLQVPGEYTVTFFCEDNLKIGDEGYFTRKYPLPEWEMFEENIDYPIEVNFFNKILTYPLP